MDGIANEKNAREISSTWSNKDPFLILIWRAMRVASSYSAAGKSISRGGNAGSGTFLSCNV